MSIQPRILIAYPQAFTCYAKFERKLNAILSHLAHFHIVYMTDCNNFISKYFSSDKRACDVTASSTEEDNNITHAIIFNDGETFNSLVEKMKKKNINSRIIELAITKVVNIGKGEKYDVYIGRGSDWGNPYAVGFGMSPGEEQDDREEAIRKFKYDFDKGYLKSSKKDAIRLKGRILGCHCKPAACHGDIIAEYVNSLDDEKYVTGLSEKQSEAVQSEPGRRSTEVS